VASEPQGIQGAQNAEAARDVPSRGLDVASNVTRAVPEPQAVAESAIRSVRHLVGHGDEVVTVRLVPESLGEMHVTVRRIGGAIELHLASAHHGVRDALESQLPAMREALAREGIDVTRASVGQTPLGDTAGNPNQSNHAAAREAFQGHARNYGGGSAARFAPNDAARMRPSTHDGTLNVLI
jgi:flagellar hook-length control protein FliK